MKQRGWWALGFVLLAITAFSTDGASPKRVLVVHSFESTAPPFTTHSTAFESALTEEMGAGVDLDEVSLDMARYAQPDMEEPFVDFLQHRLSKWQPDLVVPIGSPAGRFVAQFRQQLFPNTSILYSGLDPRLLPPDALKTNAVYVGEVNDLVSLANDMFQLAPATTNIIVVIGATPVEQYWAEAIRRAWEPYTNRASVTLLNDLPFDQVLERAARLPPHSFIFFALLVRDVTGVTYNADEALRRLHAVANAPINGVYHHQLGNGIVGGRLNDTETTGVESARVAIRILHGEPASSFPPRLVPPSVPRYDWRELQRWKISERRLPPGSVIEFRQPTPWERYRWRILGAVAVVLLEAALIVLLVTNLLKRRRTEKALRESESRFRSIADSAPVLIWMAGTDKSCTFFNKPWLDFTGRTMEQELGNGWTEGIHPDDLPGSLESYRKSFDARQPFLLQYRLRRHDGRHRWISDRGVPRYDAQGNFDGYIGSCLDITEQRLAEERLRLDAAVIENMVDGVVLVRNSDLTIVNTNPTFDRLLGYQPGELIGQHVDVINAKGGPNAHPLSNTILQTLRATGHWQGDLPNRRKDGATIWCRVSISSFAHPIHGEVGISIVADITEQRKAEAEAQHLRQELAHISRVATLGELTASIAHELNQPLAAILSNAQAGLRFMAAGKPDLNELSEIFRDIVADDQRAGQVIRHLRSLLKKSEAERRPLALNNLISDVVSVVRSDAVLRNVSITLDLASRLPMVCGDRVQLQQVVLNLVVNAFEALVDVNGRPRKLFLHTHSPGDNQVHLDVIDNGPGIAPDKLDSIFEPFITTKLTGMGMGLSVSRSIVNAHEGRLWAENNTEGGAALHMVLPGMPDDMTI